MIPAFGTPAPGPFTGITEPGVFVLFDALLFNVEF